MDFCVATDTDIAVACRLIKKKTVACSMAIT